MYKKGLMTQFPCARGREYVCKNIGDYIQTVATKQFVEPVDEYIEQEEANSYYPADKEKIRLIMNGWFQWRAENWPPSEYIYPLLISMHISPLKAETLLCKEGIDFLKRNEPVGCRDYYTKDLLEKKGIKSYFSGCMTLTLGNKYSIPKDKHRGVVFVDPFFDIPNIYTDINGKRKLDLIRLLWGVAIFLRYAPSAIKLGKKRFFRDYSPTGFLDRNRNMFRPYYKAAVFYHIYIRKFSREVLLNAQYITHWMDVKMDGSVSNTDLISIAERLVKRYASARLVVTSRIHAGLPCLGMGTPVVFVANKEVVSENGTFNTPGRLGGLLDFFRVLSLDDGVFSTDDDELSKFEIINSNSQFENKDNWIPYAQELKKKATEFMK